MENKLQKYGLIVGVLVIALSVFYYLVIFLPNKNRQEAEYRVALDNAREEARCSMSASAYAKELESKSALGFSYLVSGYKYNATPELLWITDTNPNTSCFIQYTIFHSTGYTSNITNVYTKEFISSAWYDKNGKALVPKDEERYNSMSKRIFGY